MSDHHHTAECCSMWMMPSCQGCSCASVGATKCHMFTAEWIHGVITRTLWNRPMFVIDHRAIATEFHTESFLVVLLTVVQLLPVLRLLLILSHRYEQISHVPVLPSDMAPTHHEASNSATTVSEMVNRVLWQQQWTQAADEPRQDTTSRLLCPTTLPLQPRRLHVSVSSDYWRHPLWHVFVLKASFTSNYFCLLLFMEKYIYYGALYNKIFHIFHRISRYLAYPVH